MIESDSNSTQARNIRTCEINPNHWYVVASTKEITDRPLGVIVWYHSIVIYRDTLGKIHALEDRCPHRQVKLSAGKVVEDNLECAYHGWQFNPQGKCQSIPYLTDKQQLPNCQIYSYPVQESDGFIWLFLGDKNLLNNNSINPLKIPEWQHLNYIATVSTIECKGHFSFLIENLMDMYHGHLHNNYQPWANAKLEKISANEQKIDAIYEAESYYKIDRIWSISQLFFPWLRRVYQQPLKVSYLYPHWVSNLGEYFTIYCLFCPVNRILFN